MNVKELMVELKEKENNVLKTAKLLRSHFNSDKLIERVLTSINIAVPLSEGEKKDISAIELKYIQDVYILYSKYEKEYNDLLTSIVTLTPSVMEDVPLTESAEPVV